MIERPVDIGRAGIGEDHPVGDTPRQSQRLRLQHIGDHRRNDLGWLIESDTIEMHLTTIERHFLACEESPDRSDRLFQRLQRRGVFAPILAIHSGIPCPMLAMRRPGARLASVATSMAVIAGFRATADITPIVTRKDSVTASATPARLALAVWKQS